MYPRDGILTRATTVGGDSGAWVIQNGTHRVIGHVLAWCERNHIAYICPMEILLEDMRRTLGAKRIYLPGSAEEAAHHARVQLQGMGKRMHALGHAKEDSKMEELGAAVEGLGIVDVDAVSSPECSPVEGKFDVDVGVGSSRVLSHASTHPRRSRVGLPLLNTHAHASGESDKENKPVMRSAVITVKEGRGVQLERPRVQVGGQFGEMVGVGVP
jgi:hypothetical protein